MSSPVNIYELSYQFNETISYDQFKTTYDLHLGDESKVGRKFGALPGSVLSGISFLVRSLATGTLGAIQSTYHQDRKYIKLYAFTALREAEFALGRLISLGNDAWGCYLMGRAEFHQKNYEKELDQNLFLYGIKDLGEKITFGFFEKNPEPSFFG